MQERNILVADDDEAIRNLLVKLLERAGYRVFEAANGQEAVDITNENLIDLAILDIEMPEKDGIEALREIKDIEEAIEVLILTGHANLDNLRQTIVDAGAFDYILKPFYTQELLNAVTNALMKRKYVLRGDSIVENPEEQIRRLEKEYEKKARQLREWQIKYRDIIENSEDSIIVARGGLIKFGNVRTHTMTGYTNEELLGLPYLDLVFYEDRSLIRETHMTHFEGKNVAKTYPFRMVKKTGKPFWAEATSRRTLWEDKPAVLIFTRDISARKQAEEERKKLMAAKEIAEASSRSKTGFLANMSHELRTPLNAIIGFAEILVDQTFGKLNEKQDRYANNIMNSGRHLLGIIDDILDISKVESGKIEFEPKVLSVRSLLDNSLVMVAQKAASHAISLSVEMEAGDEDMVVEADERSFKQIMLNLLSNAVKFTPDGGSIVVSASRTQAVPFFADQGTDRPNAEEKMVQIAVSDTGIGIASEHFERIFEHFQQVKNSSVSKEKGTGLGLALARELVQVHGGRIWVKSKGKDQGSVFYFQIPVKARPFN